MLGDVAFSRTSTGLMVPLFPARRDPYLDTAPYDHIQGFDVSDYYDSILFQGTLFLSSGLRSGGSRGRTSLLTRTFHQPKLQPSRTYRVSSIPSFFAREPTGHLACLVSSTAGLLGLPGSPSLLSFATRRTSWAPCPIDLIPP